MNMDMLTDTFDYGVKDTLSFLNNKHISTIVSTALVAYSAVVAPKLPLKVLKLFKNDIVQLGLFFLIAYMGTKNPTVSLVAAGALMMTIQSLHTKEMMEAESETKPVANRGLIHSCQNIKDGRNRHSVKSVPVDTQEQAYHLKSFCQNPRCKNHIERVPLLGPAQDDLPLVNDLVQQEVKTIEAPMGLGGECTNDLMPIVDMH